MTIKELYDLAVAEGIEDYTIIIADTKNREKHHGIIFPEMSDIDVDDAIDCIVI